VGLITIPERRCALLVELCRGNFLVIVSGGKRLDFAAFVLILVLSVLLCWGMKETKTVNNGPAPQPLAIANRDYCTNRQSPVRLLMGLTQGSG